MYSMSKMIRVAAGPLLALGLAVGLLPEGGAAAAAATAGATATAGYPSAAATGFHHLGLVYHNPQRTADDWNAWMAQYRGGVPVQGRWLFDSFLPIDLTAPSGNGTDTGATTAADWTALLDRWFGTAPGGGTIGAVDAAITRVAATRGSAGTPMGLPATRRKIVVTIPWAADYLSNFGVVDGRAADLRLPAERDRVVAWYLDQVRQRFAGAGYRNVDLWGVYLMREDIIPTDETWVSHTTAAAHLRGLKVAWIPYYRAPGWQQWRSFGIDVAIMQPSYGFRSPADGGQVDATRLVTTAELAQNAGLGVEVEARSSGASGYEAAMFQQYLSEGVRLGYREAATAYFLGWDRWPAIGDSYQALGDYIAGLTMRSVDPQPEWQWFGTPIRTASSAFTARGDLNGVRVQFSTGTGTWRGAVTVSQLVGGFWKSGGTGYASATPDAGTHQQLLVSLGTLAYVTGVRVTFTPAPGMAAAAVDSLVLDTVWPTGTSSLSTGLPYTVSTGAAPVGQFVDTAGTATGFGRGLLTDGQWSTTGWWNARPVGWWGDSGPVRVLFDLGTTRAVDRVVLYTHDSPDAAVNWPLGAPSVELATACPVTASTLRGAAADCGVTPLSTPGAVVIGTNGRSLDGKYTFATGAPVNARFATLLVQPTGWFLADEVQFFAGGVDVTGSVSYRLLTPPNPQNPGTGGYGDNAVRLTDGNVAPIMSGPAVTGWQLSGGFTTTVDLLRPTTVRTATAWFVENVSWGVVRPVSVTVTTSVDGVTWVPLGQAGTAARTWYSAMGYAVTGASRTARYVRYATPADPTRPTAWNMISELEAGAA
jgi:hypothetical protein